MADFQRAVDLNPNDVNSRLYLATALMVQYIPGANSAENLDMARRAESEFDRVLALDPSNLVALESLASLAYQQAQGVPDLQQKLAQLDIAAAEYEKLLAADPRNSTTYYSLAVIAWVRWYPVWMKARADLGMRPEQPGPLTDAAMRQQLKQQYSALIDQGISYLEKALDLNPMYDDAMAYMNLFIRERADLMDSPEQYRRAIAMADQWVAKALDTKKMKAESARSNALGQVQAPPPPQPTTVQRSGEAPQRIRVGGDVQRFNLIRKVEPVYPELAHQARIQGSVRFTAIIARDGHILNLQLISGHPLLVEAARQAVQQWLYKPTLLNGEPVEVVTQIDVPFTLVP